MKAIELTEEQEDKLIEMCKVLFPEYSIKFSTSKIVGDEKDFVVITRAKPYSVEYIHWFEFCHTILFKKLFKTLKFQKYHLKLESLFIISHNKFNHKNMIHPIDLLYQEFFKLYLNKSK